MATKNAIKTAKDVLDRFYRDAEGRTNRQIDVYFTLEDMDLGKERAEAAIEYLVSRGLVNSFGSDIAYLTEAGVKAVKEDVDISAIPKAVRDFEVKKSKSGTSEAAESAPAPAPGQPAPGGGRVRPKKPFLLHITAEGEEYALPLGWICTVGRQDGNDVKVNDQRASKRHAEIFYNDGSYYLRDLNSANGTLLNGEYVVEDIALKHDDEVVIGRTMILFQTPEVVPRPAGPAPEAAPENDEATVVPPASESDVEIAATERPAEHEDPAPIRVVRGSPEPVRAKGRDADVRPTPVEDLFAEAPTRSAGEREDLFAEAPRPAPKGDLFAESTPAASDDDALFAPQVEAKQSEEDLFAEDRTHTRSEEDLFADTKKRAPAKGQDLFGATPKVQSDDDLFADTKLRSGPEPQPRPSSRAKTHLAEGGLFPPRVDSGARLMAELTNEPVATEVLEEIQPLPADALGAPIDTVTPMDPGAWEEQTPADALQNQPVERLEEEPPSDEATVMAHRGEMYGSDSATTQDAQSDELPRWGEPAQPSASVDLADRGEGLPLYGEDLPEAALSLVELRAPSEAHEGLPQEAEAFRRTLKALRRATERADLPDRRALLEAIELLEGHPYIRVALKTLS